jgi:hypothetical protein
MTTFVGTIWQYFIDPSSWFGSSTATSQPKRGHKERLPGGCGTPEAPSESNTEYTDDSKDGDDDDWDSDKTFSSLNSLQSYSSDDSGRAQRRQRRRDRVPSPQRLYLKVVAQCLSR